VLINNICMYYVDMSALSVVYMYVGESSSVVFYMHAVALNCLALSPFYQCMIKMLARV